MEGRFDRFFMLILENRFDHFEVEGIRVFIKEAEPYKYEQSLQLLF